MVALESLCQCSAPRFAWQLPLPSGLLRKEGAQASQSKFLNVCSFQVPDIASAGCSIFHPQDGFHLSKIFRSCYRRKPRWEKRLAAAVLVADTTSFNAIVQGPASQGLFLRFVLPSPTALASRDSWDLRNRKPGCSIVESLKFRDGIGGGCSGRLGSLHDRSRKRRNRVDFV